MRSLKLFTDDTVRLLACCIKTHSKKKASHLIVLVY